MKQFICNHCRETFSKNVGYCPYCDSDDISTYNTGVPYYCNECGEEFYDYSTNSRNKLKCPCCGSTKIS